MKVLMVSKHFYPFKGGLEVRVLEIGRWLVKEGDEAVELTTHEKDTKDYEEVDGIKVHRSKVAVDVFNALVAPGILVDLFKQDYDLIDVNLPDPVNAAFVLLASVLRKKPVVVTYHADITDKGGLVQVFETLYWPVRSLLFKRAKKIMVTSMHYARESKPLKPWLSKVEVTPSFIAPDRFSPGDKDEALLKKITPEGAPLILFVGRLIPYKGLDVLLDAFKTLSQTHNARLCILGTGALEQDLKDRVQELGVMERVVFESGVGDDMLTSYYRSCDFFVLPSVTRQEAFGLVLVEALSCAKPAITSHFSGMPYVVGDDVLVDKGGFFEAEGGLLVPKGDPQALADAMKALLDDPGYAVMLGQRGAKRVGRLFTSEVVCGAILEIYKSCLS